MPFARRSRDPEERRGPFGSRPERVEYAGSPLDWLEEQLEPVGQEEAAPATGEEPMAKSPERGAPKAPPEPTPGSTEPTTELPKAGRTAPQPAAPEPGTPEPTAPVTPLPPEPPRPPRERRRLTVADLTTEAVLQRPPGGPTRGWQGFVYRASGGRLRPAPGPAEVAEERLRQRIGTPVDGSQRITVVSLKGGVGKTTTTACLGATFAMHRGDRVVAVDANADPGTLGFRVRREHERTTRDLLAHASVLDRYSDVRAYASQASLRLEVIASATDPGVAEPLGEEDVRAISKVLERFYSLVLTDCGPGLLSPVMRAVLPLSDQLVLVAAPNLDGARSASLMLDWLERNGFGELAGAATVVINAVRPRLAIDVGALERHFADRCRAVVRVPFDRHLETGAEIVPEELAPATRHAYLELAAAVADGFSPRPKP